MFSPKITDWWSASAWFEIRINVWDGHCWAGWFGGCVVALAVNLQCGDLGQARSEPLTHTPHLPLILRILSAAAHPPPCAHLTVPRGRPLWPLEPDPGRRGSGVRAAPTAALARRTADVVVVVVILSHNTQVMHLFSTYM